MPNLIGNSAVAAVPAVKGKNTAAPVAGVSGSSVGVEGESDAGWGVYGHSVGGRGVVAISESDYGLRAASTKSAGIRGSSVEGRGVEGWATKSEGVVGISETGNGVWGQTNSSGTGVLGTSKSGTGVQGFSESGFGLLGQSKTGRGVVAISDSDYGLRAVSRASAGIRGSSTEGRGVEGWATKSEGVVGISTRGNGVWGQTDGAGIGVLGTSVNGIGVYAKGGAFAGKFEGTVQIQGHLFCDDVHCPNADCAEDFDIADPSQADPGTVMVLGAEGSLRKSIEPYDKRVAGVVSGAGTFKPAIVLDKRAGTDASRRAIALLGKVFCKVDASKAPIEVGDLLTTSETAGHAMKAADPQRAFGAVIGKALQPLASGQGLIPILIALQ